MMGGSETATGDRDGVHTSAIHVPIGWQRRVEDGHVVYVSPSGTVLPSLDEVKTYLLTDGTCKCGLECPLVINKVFSFSVGAKVEHSPPLGKAEQDMTKLCNHRRKVVAMAALCRSMQASPHSFPSLQHPEGGGGGPDHKRARAEREGDDRGTHHHPHHKHHPLLPRLHPLPCTSPRHPSQLMYPYNGSSPGPHLDALRRLQPPPLPASSPNNASPGAPFLYGAPQRSPRTPGPQNLSQGQRSTPRTPEGPGSPRLGPLASPPPPPSSPRSLGGRTPHHGVMTGGSPLSPSPSASPSIHGASGASPRQRSRHPSSSSLSEHGGGVGGGEGGGLMGSHFPQRRKSSSSSPHSPLPGGSPTPGLHFRYKVEDLLEHCRTSGNPPGPPAPPGPLPTNQSSPHIFSALKPPKSPQGGLGFGLSAAGSSLGPFLNHHPPHHGPQSRPPHPASFPASSLLSAAAKAQLANQSSPLEALREAQQHHSQNQNHSQQQKVTNSTLLHSHPALLLLPPSGPLASPSPLPLTPAASHRKRQRRSPMVLAVPKDPQPLANGARKTPPGDAVINLSSSSTFPSSTSAGQHQSASLHHLLPPGHTPRLSRPMPPLAGPPRQMEALDFTTGLSGAPGPPLDPPTQPLSALLHLLSVQNAQASAPAGGPQGGASSAGGGGGAGVGGAPSRQSPRPLSSSSSSSSSPAPHSSGRSLQTPSPRRPGNPAPLPLSPAPSSSSSSSSSSSQARPVLSPCHLQSARSSSFSYPAAPPCAPGHPPPRPAEDRAAATATLDLSRSQGGAVVATPTSPKPLDLSNHVLALLAASTATPQGEGGSGACSTTGHHTTAPEEVVGSVSKPPEARSPAAASPSPLRDGCSPDAATPLSLAEAFPFMNQEQLLQLLSATGGLPSLLDPAVLASLPLGGLWMGGQPHPGPALAPPAQSPPDQQPHLLIQDQQHQQHQQQQKHQQQMFPLLPSLGGGQGELPLSLLGLLNPLPPPGPPAPGQEADMGLAEKAGLQALLMASLLLGQQQAPMLPLGLEVPLQPALDGLGLDKSAALLDPSALPGPGLLEFLQGLLPPPPTAEGSLQALQSLLLPGPLAPSPPSAFLPLSPALLSAALGGAAELHPTPPAQPAQHPPPQVTSDPGVDTLIPLPLQSKDNPILQQLLPTLLNPAVLGDLSCLAGLQNMLGLGAGPLLLPPVQASALGMPLLQGPDGAINLLNNIQLNIAPPPEGDKPIPLQETQSPAPQQDIPANHVAPGLPGPVPPERIPGPPSAPPAPPQQRGGGGGGGGGAGGPESGGVIDPYTSFMDTIYTSFLQVSAKEQEEGAQQGPFCALPPVSFPGEGPAPPPASAPVSLSPRRACSLRHPDLSRLSLETAAHSPAQGTPKPSDDASASAPCRRKEGGHPEPPLPPAYLEEAKTDGARRPYGDGTAERQGAGYLGPRDGASGRPKVGETAGALLHTEQGRDQVGPTVGGRRGRKRKQTLQKVLEDFRDMDTTALEETKPTTVLLKPERAGRGRRRRGARSQRQ